MSEPYQDSIWTARNTCSICGAQTPDHETHERWHAKNGDLSLKNVETETGKQT
jgi:hypothetical protein